MTEKSENESTFADTEKPAFDKDVKDEPFESLRQSNEEAQRHIKTIESENRAFREKMRDLEATLAAKEIEASTIGDLMQRIEDERTRETNNTSEPTAPRLEDLVTQVKEEVFADLSAQQTVQLEESNWDRSLQMLEEKYGDDFRKVVDDAAAELDMSVKQMEELARTSPAALMGLVDKDSNKMPQHTTSTINTGAASAQSGTEINDQYWLEIRNKDPRKWRDLETQKAYWRYLREKINKEKQNQSVT